MVNKKIKIKKVRGPDKKPRKSGAAHGNFKHGFGKTRNYDYKRYHAFLLAVKRRGVQMCNYR